MARTLRYLFVFVLLSITGTAYAQTGEFVGKVTDDNKEPIIGAVVQVFQGGINKGGGVTDYDGNYKVAPLQPGRYEIVVNYTGMTTQRIKDAFIAPSGGRVTINVKLTDNKTLEEVVIKYEAPIVSADKPDINRVLTKEQIDKLPTQSTGDAVSLGNGAYQSKSGGNVSLNGSRSEGTLYIVDGVQVTGARYINQTPGSIDQMQVLNSIPAKYGDATGGVITITTRGITKEYEGGITLQHSLDGYNNNLAAFNLSGPFLSRKDSVSGQKKPIVGFFLTGDYRYDNDNDPTYQKNYVLKDEVLKDLQDHPIRLSQTSSGVSTFRPSAEYITLNDMETQKKRVNATSQRASITGKLDYELVPGTNLTVGGSFFYTNAYNYSRTLALFAPDAISNGKSYTGRGYIRFTQRFGRNKQQPASGSEPKTNVIENAFYTVQADYQRDYSTTQDGSHKKDPFKYAYVGKFTENYQPVYGPGVDDSTGKIAVRLLGYQPTGVSYERAETNPVLANYTSEYYRLGGASPLLLSNISSTGTYLINGSGPNSVYSLWSNIGTSQGGYNYSQADQFSLGVDAQFDYKMAKSTHQISFGLYYQQRAERFYGVSGAGLWGLMRQLTHRVVPFTELDPSTATYIVGGKKYTYQDIKNGVVAFGPSDTVYYDRKFNDSSAATGGFDYNLRKKLGLNPKGREYLQPDSYDPSMYSLDMFTADELINGGNGVVSYYGYDYTGNIVNGQVNFNDYWTKKDANGNYTRPIGAYRPNYIAGYLSDNIRFKDILFSLGVRIERFDNNTKVLKDPYTLYPALSVSNADGAHNVLNGGKHPGNMESGAVAYVNDNSSGFPNIIGYRNGETWYDATGKEIPDPSVLRNYSGGRDPQPYLQNPKSPKINEEGFKPDESFSDYKPTINAMPRISFSFPISDKALFYAHYDVVYQRPKPGLNGTLTGVGAYASPVDYFYLTQNSNGTIGNPDLKPERVTIYEVGFQQSISKYSGFKMNGAFRERRNQIQVRPYVFAWPITYYTYGNRDFSTTKSLGLSYELRRKPNNHLAMTISYTLQFAEGTGSNANSSGGPSSGGLLSYLVSAQQPNLMFTNALDYDSRHIISVNADYRYNEGEGPVVAGKHILQNAGLNLLFQTRSGEPYTRLAQAQTLQGGVNNANVIIGNINTSRLPWHYMLNARLDKDFALDFRKKDGDGNLRGKKFVVNAYVFVQNILNTKDVLTVYRFTGQADDDGYLTSPIGSVAIQNQTNQQSFSDLYNLRVQNPGLYNNPRRITFGLNFNF